MRFFSHIFPCSLVVTFISVTVIMAAGTFTPIENPSFTTPIAQGEGIWILTPNQGAVAARDTIVYFSAPASLKLSDPSSKVAKTNFHNEFYLSNIDPTTGSGWPVPLQFSCKTNLVKGTAHLGYAIVLFDGNTTGETPWILIGDMGFVSFPVSTSAGWQDFSATTDIGAEHDTGGETITFKDKILQQIKDHSIVKPTIVIDIVGYVDSGTVYFDDFSVVQTTSSVLRPVSAFTGFQMPNQIRLLGNMAKFSQTTPYTVSVQNAQGRTVLSTSGTNSMVLIPQENLASGAYLVTVKTGLFGKLTRIMAVDK